MLQFDYSKLVKKINSEFNSWQETLLQTCSKEDLMELRTANEVVRMNLAHQVLLRYVSIKEVRTCKFVQDHDMPVKDFAKTYDSNLLAMLNVVYQKGSNDAVINSMVQAAKESCDKTESDKVASERV